MYFRLITTHKYIFFFGKMKNQQNPLNYFQADQDMDRNISVYLMAELSSACLDSFSEGECQCYTAEK